MVFSIGTVDLESTLEDGVKSIRSSSPWPFGSETPVTNCEVLGYCF